MYDAILTFLHQATELLVLIIDESEILVVHLSALLRSLGELWPEI